MSDSSPLGILNTAILTADGRYTMRAIDFEEACDLVRVHRGNIDSAVGHEATATLLSDLLGIEVPVNRKVYSQRAGTRALVFKLNGRAPEGVILDRERVEDIGYTLHVLFREPDRDSARGDLIVRIRDGHLFKGESAEERYDIEAILDELRSWHVDSVSRYDFVGILERHDRPRIARETAAGLAAAVEHPDSKSVVVPNTASWEQVHALVVERARRSGLSDDDLERYATKVRKYLDYRRQDRDWDKPMLISGTMAIAWCETVIKKRMLTA